MTVTENEIQERVAFLQNSSLFKELSDDRLKSIASALTLRVLDKNEKIFNISDTSDGLYIVKSGSIQIHNDSYEYSIVSQGGYFGEYSLLDDNLRTLSATAIIPSEVYLLKKEDFFILISLEPILLKGFLKNLIKRLRKKNLFEESMVRQATEIKVQSRIIEDKSFKLEKLIETKDKLFSIIAHDLKNPFNMIMALSDLLIDNPHYDETKRMEFLKHLNNSSKDVYHLLENLLQWSRTQTGQIYLSRSMLNLEDLIEENITLFKNIIKSKKITTKIQVDYKNVYADYHTINTIVRNLISNAIKFSKDNGSININTRLEENNCIVTIADTGIGMSEDQLNNLFKVGTKITRMGTNDEKGTGLGLLIIKEFVDANGGTIHVESVEEQGTTFTISLPLREIVDK